MAEERPPNDSQRPVQHLPYELNYITDELKKRAESELFEDEATINRSLRILRAMLKEEKNLHWQDDDLFLLAFLRARKYDVKRAFSLMKTFYEMKLKRGELYDNFRFETVSKTLEENTVSFLPYRDHDSCPIIVVRVGPWNPCLNTIGDIVRVLTVGLLHAVTSPATQVSGVKVITDFNGFTLRQLTHFSPTYLWLVAEAMQSCFPARFREIHVVGETHIFSYIWKVLKGVLTKKIADRFHFHGKNVKKLHKYFHPSILPAEFDGELPPFSNKEWYDQLSQSSIYLTMALSYGYKKRE